MVWVPGLFFPFFLLPTLTIPLPSPLLAPSLSAIVPLLHRLLSMGLYLPLLQATRVHHLQIQTQPPPMCAVLATACLWGYPFSGSRTSVLFKRSHHHPVCAAALATSCGALPFLWAMHPHYPLKIHALPPPVCAAACSSGDG